MKFQLLSVLRCFSCAEREAADEGSRRPLQLSRRPGGGQTQWRKTCHLPQRPRLSLTIPAVFETPPPKLLHPSEPEAASAAPLHDRRGRRDERLKGQRSISFVQGGVTSESPACERSRGVSGTHNRARRQISLGLREPRTRFFLIRQKNNSTPSRTDVEKKAPPSSL